MCVCVSYHRSLKYVVLSMAYFSIDHCSFDVIAQESNTIMNSLRLRLNSSIQGDPNTISQSDFIESVSYLIRLGAPVSSLVERYVSYHRYYHPKVTGDVLRLNRSVLGTAY